MSVNLSFIGGAGWQFFDDNGNPLSGGKIYTYAAGTTTPQSTYTSRTGLVPNTNPIILDAAGRTPEEVWSTEGLLYKYVVADSNEVIIRTWDYIGGSVVASDLAANLASTSDNADGDALVGFKQSDTSGFLTGATARTVNGKLQDIISVFDFMTSAQIVDVQSGDASLDTLAAFEAAIASFPTTFDENTYSYAGTILVPPGRYYLSGTLTITRQIRLVGASSPQGNGIGNTQLIFADDVDGIVINNESSAPPNLNADGTTIQYLYLARKNNGGTNGHGIYLKGRANIRNVTVEGFRKNGINIEADATVAPLYSNANCWKVYDCVCISNDGHGIYVDGGDTNAGVCIGLDCRSNSGWGVYDSSFLGNTYVGCHTSNNTLGAYKTDSGNARNVFVGCYAEGGQAIDIATPSMVLGGTLGFDAQTPGISGTGTYFGEGYLTPTQFVSQETSTAILGLGGVYTGAGEVFAVKTTTEASGAYPFRWKSATGRFYWDWANNSTSILEYTNSQATVANGFPREVYSTAGGAAVAFRQGFFGGENMKQVAWGSAAPASGAHVVGDIVFNDAPSAGGYIGWVCTSAGSPGTWKTFGAISA